MSESRDKILKNLKNNAGIQSPVQSHSENIEKRIQDSIDRITPDNYDDLKKQFQEELELTSSEFFTVQNTDDLVKTINKLLQQCGIKKAAISGCEFCNEIISNSGDIEFVKAVDLEYPERKKELALISAALVEASCALADTGTLVFLFDECRTTLPHFLSEFVIAVIRKDNLMANQFDFFKKVPADRIRNMVFMSGPSRTADIEKILILGAHGPRRLAVILLE